jgi:hypothetical protein
MFGKVQFFFIIEFQYGGLTDDHKLIWVKMHLDLVIL